MPIERNKPDLVIVCQVFYPELISTGQTLTELVEELSASGLNITVIASQPTLLAGSKKAPKEINYKGIRIVRIWSTRLPKTVFIGKLLNLCIFFISANLEILFKYSKSQLLLLTNPPYLPLTGWLFNLIRNQTFGVILFDIMPEQAELLNFIKPDGFIAKTWRRMNHLWYQRAAYSIVLSRDMLTGALKNANLLGTKQEESARNKTHIIHVWADDRLISPMPKTESKEAARLGFQNLFVVQYSGNHGRFHDIETLLDIARLFNKDDGFVFQFIGDGQKKQLVLDLMGKNPGVPVFASGYVEKKMLPDSLAMADIGVVAQMPGQENVCFPSKLLGIMASGRPVLAICPPECEMARMIMDNDMGFVVDNRDVEGGRSALLKAKTNPGKLNQMGANAFNLLRDKFTLSKAAQQYLKIIRFFDVSSG